MSPRSENKIASTSAIAGSALLLIGTWLHPMPDDPNQAVEAFTAYAADRLWVASHLTQLVGIALMVAARAPRAALENGQWHRVVPPRVGGRYRQFGRSCRASGGGRRRPQGHGG